MTETESWDEESRNDLREILRSIVIGEVRLGKDNSVDILETCREVYIEDECPEHEQSAFMLFAENELGDAISQLKSDQALWPDETDCDRLDRVEDELREQGILFWQVSPCCDSCTGAELPDRIDKVEDRHPGFRSRVCGYAFFIDQNMPEMLAESTDVSVYLAYGWFSPDDSDIAPDEYKTKALDIAREVSDSQLASGFEVDWDGDFSRKIGVSLNWQKRRSFA